MDLLKGELGFSDKSCVPATIHGNTVANMQCEIVSHVTEEVDQGAMNIQSIKTEPIENCVPVVSVTQISYGIYPELPAPISLCCCERKF